MEDHVNRRSAITMAQVMTLLSLARDNKVNEIEAVVIKQGIPVDVCNQMGQTALHIAALWGNVEAAAALIRLGAEPNTPNARGTTPLHFAAAAKSNMVQMCKLLKSLGADTGALDMMGRAPYELAASDEVRALLGGPDPRIFQYSSQGDATALQQLLAAGTGQAGDASAGKVSVRVVDSAGRTPLNLAVGAESLDTVKVILAHDATVLDIPDSTGDTALHVAAGVGDLNTLNYLLSLKPESLNMQNLDQSEYSAGNWLLHGEVVEPLDKTPLAIAVQNGDLESATALLAAGAEVDAVDFEKRTPLLSALEESDGPMAKLLLEHGANPNAPSQDFVSGLHLLATRGPVDLIPLMISKGADVNKANDEGWTPLHLASRSGKKDRVAALLQGGAAVNAVNTQGNTALHLAAVNGHVPVIELLLLHKASKDIHNKDGKTPVMMAKADAVKAALA